MLIENDKKIIKRDWNIVKSIPFTYTSIVRVFLQAKILYNPIYTVFELVFA